MSLRSLESMIRESDNAVLRVIAEVWGVDANPLTDAQLADALKIAMLDPVRAEAIYDRLADQPRGALQTLVGSGGKLNRSMFERMYGEIRSMGRGRIEREQPLTNPASASEALYYRGLIAIVNEMSGTGIMPMIYIPDELAGIMPTHKTGYSPDALEASTPDAKVSNAAYEVPPLDEVEDVRPADTSLVDDMATLLAFIRLVPTQITDNLTLNVNDDIYEVLAPNLLIQNRDRLAFMIGIGIGAGLLDVQEGIITPKRAETKRWLESPRAAQVKWLVDGWRQSDIYLELWHTPGLHPEPTGWPYDPVNARARLMGFLSNLVPAGDWWSLDEFIFAVKEDDPDFQRPGGNYDSWYIRNDDDEFLHGFESWDAVEGALLEFYIMGPLYWLGLVDLAQEAGRLTAYGRGAILPDHTWPQPPDPDDRIIVNDDGTLLVSRKISRFERFQLSRFTTWIPTATLDGSPYTYRLDADGIKRATEQGITTAQIGAFINRVLDNAPMPALIGRLLQNWQSGAAAAVSMERMLVLRTTAPETLDSILNEPALRRFLGARLGPMAVVVRADPPDDLLAALGERGIDVSLQ